MASLHHSDAASQEKNYSATAYEAFAGGVLLRTALRPSTTLAIGSFQWYIPADSCGETGTHALPMLMTLLGSLER